MLYGASQFPIFLCNAPSQSGKTVAAALIALMWAWSIPDSTVLFLSTNQDQTDRMLRILKNKFVDNTALAHYSKLKTDRKDFLTFAFNNSSIVPLPHSIKAVTGNSGDLIVLDELSKFDKNPEEIFAESLARVGDTSGHLAAISTFWGDGKADHTQPAGHTGNFFAYKFREIWNNPGPDHAAVSFTYHVSDNLVKNKARLEKGMGHPSLFREHYVGIPRMAAGRPVFQHYFDRSKHTKPLDELIETYLSYEYPLFLCFDPGLRTGAVLGQLNPEGPKGSTIIGLHAWLSTGEQTMEAFIKSIWQQVTWKYAKKGYQIAVFCDVAANQKNRQTLDTDALVISRVTGQEPYRVYQHVEPGIQVIKSYMTKDTSFLLNADDSLLADTFDTGLVQTQRAGVYSEAYVKDGYYEHIGDAFRYPVYVLSEGLTADMADEVGDFGGIKVQTTRGDYG